MDTRVVLKNADRVVRLPDLARGDTVYVVSVSGNKVTIWHSGEVQRIPNIQKGAHNGPLPVVWYHGSTMPVDLYPDSFGFGGKDVTSYFFLALMSVAPLTGVRFEDQRPDTEKNEHKLEPDPDLAA